MQELLQFGMKYPTIEASSPSCRIILLTDEGKNHREIARAFDLVPRLCLGMPPGGSASSKRRSREWGGPGGAWAPENPPLYLVPSSGLVRLWEALPPLWAAEPRAKHDPRQEWAK